MCTACTAACGELAERKVKAVAVALILCLAGGTLAWKNMMHCKHRTHGTAGIQAHGDVMLHAGVELPTASRHFPLQGLVHLRRGCANGPESGWAEEHQKQAPARALRADMIYMYMVPPPHMPTLFPLRCHGRV